MMNFRLLKTPADGGIGSGAPAPRWLSAEPGHDHCHCHGHGHGNGHGREAGYTLVMLVIIIAVMSISMGVAVQTAEFQMRREREAELIFRGQQYVEAIRLYKLKYGRYPMQLKELYEAKPRVIRKEWKDPITDSESWGLIFLGQQGNRPGQQGRRGASNRRGGQVPGASPIETQTPFGSSGSDPDIDPNTGLPRSSSGSGEGQKMGPIVGVHSTSCDEAIKVWEGRTTYCEWKFVFREEQQQQGQRGGRRQQRQRGYHAGDILGKQVGDDGATGGAGGSGGAGGGVNPPPPIRTPNP